MDCSQGVSHVFFLVMLGVIPVAPGDKNKAGESVMNELSVTAFPTRYAEKTTFFQIGNELANLAGLTKDTVTSEM